MINSNWFAVHRVRDSPGLFG